MISQSFTKIEESSGAASYFTDIEQIGPHLWRAKKGGKFFILKGASDDSARAANLLKREYEIAAPLSHEGVVSVVGFEQIAEIGDVIVMEYVDGRNLEEFVKEKPSLAVRRRVFEQILGAVGYLHRKGLTHNDLKPQNILVTTRDNSVKIIDLGFADDDANFLEKKLGGTPGYASPELEGCKSAECEVDSRSDIYSLGIIMKDLFGGKYVRISSKCTRTVPDERYANVDALAKAFKQRNLWKWIVGVAVLVAVIALSIGLYVRYLKAESSSLEVLKEMRLPSDFEVLKEKGETQVAEFVSSLTGRYTDSCKYYVEDWSLDKAKRLLGEDSQFVTVKHYYEDEEMVKYQCLLRLKINMWDEINAFSDRMKERIAEEAEGKDISETQVYELQTLLYDNLLFRVQDSMKTMDSYTPARFLGE